MSIPSPAWQSPEAPAATATARPSERPWLGLAWTLVRTDFKSRYHGGKASGFVWALLKPVAMFLVLVSVFSFVFERSDYVFNLMVALTLWDFFSEGTLAGVTSLASKGHLVGKVKFPRIIVVAASSANAWFRLLVSATAVLLAIGVFHRTPGVFEVALVGLYVLLFGLMVFGFSLAASVLYLHYRDLNQIWELILQAGFFVAPIIYPIDIFPERFHFYLYLWPATPPLEFARSVLVAGVIPSFKAQLLFGAEALLVAALGVAIYHRKIDRAVERL